MDSNKESHAGCIIDRECTYLKMGFFDDF
jgi:hypothetical protein